MPNLPSPIQFTLRDATGTDHTYEVLPHPATDGSRIMWQLYAMGVEPLGKLAGSLLTADGLNVKSLRGLLDDPAALEKIRSSVDLGALAAAIRAALVGTSMPALTQEILHHTRRDGLELRNPAHFDAAYACNYWELSVALWKVVQANRFLPGLPS